jgi:predicted membrane chloride channel (bestrophin family)
MPQTLLGFQSTTLNQKKKICPRPKKKDSLSHQQQHQQLRRMTHHLSYRGKRSRAFLINVTAAFLSLLFSTSSMVTAFVNRQHIQRRQERIPCSSWHTQQQKKKTAAISSNNHNRISQQPIDEESDDEDDPKTSWLRWMIGGKPRGTSKVIMREAAELGGLPRSDRYSSRDRFHNTASLPNSAILRDIRSPVLAVTSWATFLSVLHEHLLTHHCQTVASRLYIPSSPHSLMMSALGLLLVFRTNSAYQRFAEGRMIWENIVNGSGDFYRMLMLYEDQIGIDKRRRVQRLLAAFPYLLRDRIRPNLVAMRRLDDLEHARDPQNSILIYQDGGPTDLDPEAAAVAQTEEETGKSRRKTRPLYWVDKRTLPWRLLPANALDGCARSQNRPLWVCDRMAQEIRTVPDQNTMFTARERLAILSHIDKLSRCICGVERIHQTVVPLNYARHTLRALTVWLFSLPFAVVKELKLLTGPVLFVVCGSCLVSTKWLSGLKIPFKAPCDCRLCVIPFDAMSWLMNAFDRLPFNWRSRRCSRTQTIEKRFPCWTNKNWMICRQHSKRNW